MLVVPQPMAVPFTAAMVIFDVVISRAWICLIFVS